MLNPFIPTHMASLPQDFFGREEILARANGWIQAGSIAIQGSTGLGKSSLLSRLGLHFEGFQNRRNDQIVIVTASPSLTSIDECARLILDQIVVFDSSSNSIRFGIKDYVEFESQKAKNLFSEGRHLTSLITILSNAFKENFLGSDRLIIISIDEAHKATVPLAQFVRAFSDQVQHLDMMSFRFILSGVNPFFERMVEIDEGLNRFFSKKIQLEPFSFDDSISFLDERFTKVVNTEQEENRKLSIDPSIIERIAKLSGGHPHILQLLGFSSVDNEQDDPDGIIDAKDLTNSIKEICFDKRDYVYRQEMNLIEGNGYFREFKSLVGLAGSDFPSSIRARNALDRLDDNALNWFLENNILTIREDGFYSFVDEFLRLRFIMSAFESEMDSVEEAVIYTGEIDEDISRGLWDDE